MKRLQINVSDKDYKTIKTYAAKNRKPISKIVTEIINFHKDGFDGFKTMREDYKSKERILIGELQGYKTQVELLSGIIARSMSIESVKDIEVTYTEIKKGSPMDELAGCSGYLPKDKKHE